MKNGFTLIELLAAMVILGLLVIITIPTYNSILYSIKKDNLSAKVHNIEIAALKYGDTIKDDVKNGPGSCIKTDVKELIQKGYLMSENDVLDEIYNPVDNLPLDGEINICYNYDEFDINAKYVFD